MDGGGGTGRIGGYFLTFEKSKISRFFKREKFQKNVRENFEKIFKVT